MDEIKVGDLVTVDVGDESGFWEGTFVVDVMNNISGIHKFCDAHECWFSLSVQDYGHYFRKVTLATQRGTREIGVTRC